MRSKYTCSLLWLLALHTLAIAQEPSFFLKDGDRVVFYGDSITDQRLYTTFAETYALTRFPKLKVSFVHSGWGGDRVSGGGGGNVDLRLERDVLAYRPSVMTIMLGMNDGAYRAFDQEIFDRYRTGYEHIVSTVKERLPGLRFTLIEPSPFDEVTQPPRVEGGYNQVLVRYGEFVKELGQREHCQVADLNAPVVAALEKAKETDPELAKKIIPDRVHPGAAGHLLMAGALLRSWNAPQWVAAVELDVPEKKVVQNRSARVTDFQAADTITWTELDEALPMPVDMKDAVVALAVNSSDFIQTLDQELLKVTGLSAAKYELSIDGASVGEFTKEQLGEGVNLATLPTPMLKQAFEVHRLTLEHNNIHFLRWRQIQVPTARFKSERVQDAAKSLMSTLDDEEEAVVNQQRAAAQPVEHHYQLKAQ